MVDRSKQLGDLAVAAATQSAGVGIGADPRVIRLVVEYTARIAVKHVLSVVRNAKARLAAKGTTMNLDDADDLKLLLDAIAKNYGLEEAAEGAS